MADVVNPLLNALGDAMLSPWRHSPWPISQWPVSQWPVSQWLALAAGSLVVAIMLVGLFRLTANQGGIRRARNQLIARVMELVLFRHDLGVSLTACGRILVANVRYLGQFVLPMLVAFIPLMLLVIQLGCWFDHRPLRAGESTVVQVHLRSPHSVLREPIVVTLTDGLRRGSEIVRVARTNEAAVRIDVTHEGDHWVKVQIAGQTERKLIPVARGLARESSHRPAAGTWAAWFSPSEPSLAATSPIDRIDVRLPLRDWRLFGYDVHWLVPGLLLMMGFGLVVGWLLGVSVA